MNVEITRPGMSGINSLLDHIQSLTLRVKELEAEADKEHAKAVELCDKLILLRDRERALEKQNNALLEYARHAATCPMPAKECDCGLDQLLKALELK